MMEAFQSKKHNNIPTVIVFIFSMILALCCASFLCSRYRDLSNAKKCSDELYGRFSVANNEATINTIEWSAVSTADSVNEIPVRIDMEALTAEYPDVVGWLHCDGTEISYPVVQSSDNTYYLNHLITGEYNFFGSIFLDCASSSDFTDNNSFIYGHNMRTQGMFYSLLDYADQKYYDEHPIMFLFTKDATYCLHIFSAYTARSDADAYSIDLYSTEKYSDYLQLICDSSVIQSDVTVDRTDHIVTLSTCSYDFSDARFLVHCLLERI